MNRTLIAACWRERLSRPLVVALLVVIALVTFINSWTDRTLSDPSAMFALILATGLVGRDVSSGALALLFCRPIRRSEYLLSRWLAGGLAAAVLGSVALLAQLLMLRLRGAGASGVDLLWIWGNGMTAVFGLASSLVFFSTLVRGIGDLGLWFLASTLTMLCELAGLLRLGRELYGFLLPRVDWQRALGAQPISWFEIISYASSVTLFLALALLMINRKELSYASHA
jgi:hypothetical protein